MKYLKIILLIPFLFSPLKAQDETLFGGEIESGWYVAPLLKVGEIARNTGTFFGVQGGWIINHRLVLGGIFYGLLNDVEVQNVTNLKLKYGSGGVLLEYIFSSNKLLHVSIQSMVGAGGVRYDINKHEDAHDKVNYSDDSFFVLEPGVSLVLNVSDNFRIGAGATYRFVSGVEYESLSNSDINGASGQVYLKFGVL